MLNDIFLTIQTGDVIYSVLQGVSSLSQLSSTEQKKITDTVIARLVVGGTTSLSESNNMVILNWHYPTRYSADSMVTRFNQGRADILANINWPVPVAHLTGFADATTTFPGEGGQVSTCDTIIFLLLHSKCLC